MAVVETNDVHQATSQKAMDNFESYYCRVPILLLKLAGAHPLQSTLTKRICVFIYVTVNVSVNIPMYAEVFVRSSDRWKSISDEEEKKILAAFVNIARLMGLILTAYMLFNCGMMIPALLFSTMIFDHYRGDENVSYTFPLLMSDYVYIDAEEHFWVTWVHFIVAYTTEMILLASFVGIYVIFISEICGLFDIVCYRLSNHVKCQKTIRNRSKTKQLDNQRSGLEQVVILHDEVLQYCALVEDAFNSMLMFVEASLAFCISLSYVYLAYGVEAEHIKRYFDVVIVVGLNVALFCVNWVGQEVIDYSGKVFDSA
ncbi:hypothetical protein QAD02_010489 [Eretmocerus hayati]|uniref:Uncharacterized protein n=1 Tax=Eretmocerus hayati TaxID=131215 RepID=A0ACC2NV10_9HYME|nr:hypothetical protein QAD02_010489 [Eretmocerus hayati]